MCVFLVIFLSSFICCSCSCCWFRCKSMIIYNLYMRKFCYLQWMIKYAMRLACAKCASKWTLLSEQQKKRCYLKYVQVDFLKLNTDVVFFLQTIVNTCSCWFLCDSTNLKCLGIYIMCIYVGVCVCVLINAKNCRS